MTPRGPGTDRAVDGEPGRFEGRAAIEQFNPDVHQRIRGSLHLNDNHQFLRHGDAVLHRCYGVLHIPEQDRIRTLLMTYVDLVVREAGSWKFRERVNRYFDPAVVPPDLS